MRIVPTNHVGRRLGSSVAEQRNSSHLWRRCPAARVQNRGVDFLRRIQILIPRDSDGVRRRRTRIDERASLRCLDSLLSHGLEQNRILTSQVQYLIFFCESACSLLSALSRVRRSLAAFLLPCCPGTKLKGAFRLGNELSLSTSMR